MKLIELITIAAIGAAFGFFASNALAQPQCCATNHQPLRAAKNEHRATPLPRQSNPVGVVNVQRQRSQSFNRSYRAGNHPRPARPAISHGQYR